LRGQTEDARQQALDSLSLDGVSIEDLDLFFVLPGTTIELKKGGKDTQVTLHNLHEYLQVTKKKKKLQETDGRTDTNENNFFAFALELKIVNIHVWKVS
jgi:hypothetical protein